MDNQIKRQAPIYPNTQINISKDPNTNELIAKIVDRCDKGMDQFGITMRQKMLQNPKDCLIWMQDALEESIDFSRYMIEAINSYRILNEENKKLKIDNDKKDKQIKELKETLKLMYEHP
tara:strand:- start:651 stop:1007 length:357 start_codon:yes stop_codon:yes gene_type:complete